MSRKKPPLGRGLGAMLGRTLDETRLAGEGTDLRDLPVDVLQPGRYQPRSVIDPERLNELAASIKAQGVVQPIVARPLAAGGYEIIAGERRWRAAQLAGLKTIPAVIREVPDEITVAMALIENIQREDLNPLEEAVALKRLIEEFAMTHQAAADAVGRSRAVVSNLLRLLELPAQVRQLIDQRRLDMGHARALLALPREQIIAAAHKVSQLQLSVRATESLVQRLLAGGGGRPRQTRSRRDPDIVRLETTLGEKLGTRVGVEHRAAGGGKLVIHYHDSDHLQGLLQRLKLTAG